MLEEERLRQLPVQVYDLLMDLEVNPMNMKGQLAFRDMTLRIQPLLSQKMDELGTAVGNT